MTTELSYKSFTQSAQFKRISTLLEAHKLSPKQVFTMAVNALDLAIGGMEPDIKYETEDLFDASVWLSMRKAVRRCIGMCLSYLAGNGLVPLVYANKPTVKNKLYRLKPSIDPALCSFRVF